MIIINESEYAQLRIKKKNIGENIYTTIYILSKYFYNQGLKKKAVCIELHKFLEIAYPKYSTNKSYWTDVIEKTATRTSKDKLFISDGIWITESEWDKIEQLQNTVLKKLAFTLICIAKVNNQKRIENNNWVNTDIKDIYKMADISCSVDLRAKRIGLLIKHGLIEFAKRVDNLNLKVLFINENSNRKFFISDFRDLGNEYLYRIGDNYIRCAECGKLVKNNINKTRKYCNECVGYIPVEKKQLNCIDCGKPFFVNARISNKCRCDECQSIFRKQYKAKKELERYHKNKK